MVILSVLRISEKCKGEVDNYAGWVDFLRVSSIEQCLHESCAVK